MTDKAAFTPLSPKIPKPTLDKLGKLGIHTRFDLVLHLPLRYEDETRITAIEQLIPGEPAQVEGEITHSEVTFRPRRTLICQLRDDQGDILFLRFLNFYPSQQKQLEVGKRIRALGEARMGFYGIEMVHPKCRAAGDNIQLKQSLTAIYPTVAGLTQPTLNKLILNALQSVELSDTLPQPFMARLGLPNFADSVQLLHNPPPDSNEAAMLERTHPAWQRIKFDELLAQQLSMRAHYRKRQQRKAPKLAGKKTLIPALLKALPFALTAAQQKVFSEISQDLALTHPMQRLLQGDVGSGKTVVAALAALQAIESGYQAALMAPTEILAEQHYLKLSEWLTPLGITPVWLSGGLKKKDKQAAIDKIAGGETRLAIGTHALFQTQVEFHKLGLVIVDEQHKFGVQQRLALRGKAASSISVRPESFDEAQDRPAEPPAPAPSLRQAQGERGTNIHHEPHQLMMSATPIPRTLAMSYYADLDVSVIDQLPPGRTPIVTKLINDSRRDEVIERIRSTCGEGKQTYWVCPLIDDNAVAVKANLSAANVKHGGRSQSETLQLQTALDTHATLTELLPELNIGLVHGKLPNADKAAVMAAFKANELHLLVATTVIEVGVDVPNASVMVIDHAERMGLSQLHQLRGRVGRGAEPSLCILLFQTPLSELARARLKVIYENTDGFEIARQDMALRGPGELLGARQSGMPMLRFADITQDALMLELARDMADELLRDYPEAAQAHLQRWMANKPDYLQV